MRCVRFVLFLLAVCFIAAPASAQILRVEWEGIATEHRHRELPNGTTGPVEVVNFPVAGFLEVDLTIVFEDPEEYDFTGGTAHWSGLPYPAPFWSVIATAFSTTEIDEDLSYHRGECNVECRVVWGSSGLSGFSYFSGDGDPDYGVLDLSAMEWISGAAGYMGDAGLLSGYVTSSIVTVIPEPSTALLLALGLGVLGSRRGYSSRAS